MMSYICAIAVYAGHELADITLYREWEMKDLFIESSALMALFSDCHNKKEYLTKRYTFEERIARNTGDEKEVTQWCLETADFILAADLDRMSLYPLDGSLPADQWVCRFMDHHDLENADTVLRSCRISFEDAECGDIVNLFLDDDRLLGRLSGKLRACYVRAGRMDEDFVNQWYDA